MKKTLLFASVLALSSMNMATATDLNYHVDNFADIEVLRYEVPGFEELSLNEKKLVYYLTEAALQGRDILFDQNCKYNLAVRQTLEAIYANYKGDKNDAEYKAFEKYLKQVWFANGIHHHYSTDKFTPEFSKEWYRSQIAALTPGTLKFVNENPALFANLEKVIFDAEYMKKRTNQAEGVDIIQTSACNYYEGVTQKEVEDYYASLKDLSDPTPVMYGLNSKKIKVDGKVVEDVYKIGGLYSNAIEKIVFWLEKAKATTESEAQRKTIEQLIEYYTTGDLKKFDEYSISWAEDTQSKVDFVNGFIESYGDPLGMTASWESIVNFKNLGASKRTSIISSNAHWFEQNSPVDNRFKKENVKGISAKVITACILAGDCYPSTPIGVNLPNSNWIRAEHGSKSVTIENITTAYDIAAKGNGFAEEFILEQEDRDLIDKYGVITDNLHTDLHECLGHASGKLLPGVDPDALKEHGSTLEEARADLFALYYLGDPKLLELGLLDNKDAYKAEYYKYLLNGLMTQLMRIEPGKDVEEAHMRNRKMISEWVMKHGAKSKVVQLIQKDGKTYLKINNYKKLRKLFGQLLEEVQRIKSEGDYKAGAALVEKYGVKVDQKLHQEVLDRYAKLHISPYKGFVNPVYVPEYDAQGNITDIKLDYTEGYMEQMLRYSKDYSPLTR